MEGKFTCGICGKRHKFFRSFDFPMPDSLIRMDDLEKGQRVKNFGDYFVLDGKDVFIKGRLFIDIANHPVKFILVKTWMLSKLEELITTMEKRKVNPSVSPPLKITGTIANEISNQKAIHGEQVAFELSDNEMPIIKFCEAELHEFTANEYHSVLEYFFHFHVKK